jgi:3-hydroxyisobutyrate dehydrogenase/2-hydroxy-3-oxopropionate reductase
MADESPVAFLGTGLMGSPMATRLIEAGFAVRVWNRTEEKARALAKKGAKFCSESADAVRGAKFICLCLTDASAVEAVIFGDAAKYLVQGAIVIDFSTIGVAAARDFAARASAAGVAWLDCPVSGGVAGATAGSLSIFAGGDVAALKQAQPLLDCVAARVTRLGDAGAGQAAKLCNQLIVSTSLVAIAEALALAGSLDVDVEQLVGALRGGFADSKPLQIFGPRMAQASDSGPKVAEIATMMKDVDAIAQTAATLPIATPLLDRVRELYARALQAGLGRDDLPALIRLYRDKLLQDSP